MIVKDSKKKGQSEQEYRAVFFDRDELKRDFNLTIDEIHAQIDNIENQLEILKELTKWISIVD